MIECLSVFFIFYIGKSINASDGYFILAYFYMVIVIAHILKPKR